MVNARDRLPGPGATADERTSVCILCRELVTEDDYRREIDCPNKYCPGRAYHEDCIASYLKKTKYSQDRCTGFPCPAVMPNSGKPCPGYVCKMHKFFPTNKKKQQRKMEAAVAQPPAPKQLKAAAGKGAAEGVQVALKAIAGADAPKVKLPSAVKVAAGAGKAAQPAAPPAATGPRIIPGLTGPIAAINTREQLRAAKAKLQAEVRAPPGRNQPVAGADPGGFKGGVANMQATMAAAVARKAKAEWGESGGDGEDGWAPPDASATLWDAIAVKANSYGKPQAGARYAAKPRPEVGGFSKLYKKRLGLGEDEPSDDMGSDEGAHARGNGNFIAEDFPALVAPPDSPGALSPVALMELEAPPSPLAKTHAPGFANDTGVAHDAIAAADESIAATPEDHPDVTNPVVEYDIVYSSEDGMSLVLNDVLQVYVRPEDVYGAALEMVDCMADDGNTYRCIAVRELQRQARSEWVQQQVRLQEQQVLEQQQQVLEQERLQEQQQQAAFAAAAGAAVPAFQPVGAFSEAAAVEQQAPFAGGLQEEETGEDGDELASLMQLLCV